MPSFSQRSLKNLAQCHPDLREVALEAIKEFDFVVICGYRNRQDQERAFNDGKSNAHYGQTGHNYSPSLALDAVPYPIDWGNTVAFQRMGKAFLAAAKAKGISITWGGSWKMRDYPHFELSKWKELKND